MEAILADRTYGTAQRRGMRYFASVRLLAESPRAVGTPGLTFGYRCERSRDQ